MKTTKLFKLILSLLIIASFVLNTDVVNAETESSVKEAEFLGTITPIHKFYKDEYPNSTDFIINGKFFDTLTGLKLPNEDWKLFVSGSIKNNSINLTLSYDKADCIGLYKDIQININVDTVAFNPKLKCSLNDYCNYDIDTTDINNMAMNFSNSLNKNMHGNICYSYDDIDNNVLNFSFIPDKKFLFTSYGYEEYDIYKGKLLINSKVPLLSDDNLVLNVGQEYELNIDNKLNNCVYNWESSDDLNVSVDNNGKIKAESLGQAFIICKITTENGDIIKLKSYVDVK